MGTIPAIERVVSNILLILEQSNMEEIEPIEIPGQYEEEFISSGNVNAETRFYSIDPAVYNLFKTAIKRINGGQLKSIQLISYPLHTGNISDIEQLSNKLYEILKDHTVGGLGPFNKSDASQLAERRIWPGKLWIHYDTGSLITLDMFEGVTKLTIIKGNST